MPAPRSLWGLFAESSGRDRLQNTPSLREERAILGGSRGDERGGEKSIESPRGFNRFLDLKQFDLKQLNRWPFDFVGAVKLALPGVETPTLPEGG